MYAVPLCPFAKTNKSYYQKICLVPIHQSRTLDMHGNLRHGKAKQHKGSYNHILLLQSLHGKSLQQRGDANLVLFLQQ